MRVWIDALHALQRSSVAALTVVGARRAFSLAAALWLAQAAVSAAQASPRSYGPRHGYVDEVQSERRQTDQELALLEPPPPEKAPLQDRIFVEDLNREFRRRYQERFGFTEAQEVYFAPNRSTFYADLYGFQGTPEQNSDARRAFGEYMVRRLAEYHVDNYAKNDPKARVVWEAKERISSLKVEVATFRFDARYSFSGNVVDLLGYSPYGDARVSFRGADNEAIVTLMRKITPTFAVETHYYFGDGVASIIGRRYFTPLFSTSLTASTFVLPTGRSVRESLYLAGLRLAF